MFYSQGGFGRPRHARGAPTAAGRQPCRRLSVADAQIGERLMSGYDVSAWGSFLAAEVGAGAALTGLLFVAVSINLARILSFPKLPCPRGRNPRGPSAGDGRLQPGSRRERLPCSRKLA